MATVTARPWFAITTWSRVVLPGGGVATVLARPTAESAVIDAPPHCLSVVPTDYIPVVESDENEAIVALLLAFPGSAIVVESS